MADTLHVKILSPTQTIYDGEALSVSSKNTLGNFDILPFHANFITMIKNEAVTIRVKKLKEQSAPSGLKIEALEELFSTNTTHLKFQFDVAIIYAKDNIVKIYTNIQTDIDKKP